MALEGLDLICSLDLHKDCERSSCNHSLPPCGLLEKDHYPLFLAPIAVCDFAKCSPPVFSPKSGTKSYWELIAELARAVAELNGQPLPNNVPPCDMLDRMPRTLRRE